MFTSIKNRTKNTFCLTIGLIGISLSTICQPAHLQPEVDINSGLLTNSVRVIKKDNFGKLWLGTDAGLLILNSRDTLLNIIKKKVAGQSIWALEFYKHFVFVGTRLNGLLIYDLKSKQLIHHFDSSQIGLCRRLRLINDTVYLATRGQAFYFTLNGNKWIVHKLFSQVTNGFFTDFCKWDTTIVSTLYWHTNQFLYKLSNDSLVPYINLNHSNIKGFSQNAFILKANDSLLLIGGDGFAETINKSGSFNYDFTPPQKTSKIYPIWDAEIVGSKKYLTTGNPDNNQEGMIYEFGVNTLGDLHKNFYGQSLYYDFSKKAMWAGTSNTGLYYWPDLANSHFVKGGVEGAFTYKPISESKGLLYSYNKVIYTDITKNNSIEIIKGNGKKSNPHTILNVDQWNDTTAVLLWDILYLVCPKKNVYKQIVYNYNTGQGLANQLFKNGNKVYLFSIHYDLVFVIDLLTSTVSTKKITSNQIQGLKYRDKYFYFSTNTGFHYFDTASHSFNIPIPTVESFTIQADTLFILNGGVIKSYKINIDSNKLIPLFENNITEKISGFTANWLLSCRGKVFCGNNKGFFTINQQTGNPVSYYYMGNYSQGLPPVSNSNLLYFNHQNYITAIDPDSTNSFIDIGHIAINIHPDKVIYRNNPFTIDFNFDDYILQKHSLKQMEIYKNGQLLLTQYTLEDQFNFPSGMEQGAYVIRFKVNDVFVAEKNISIVIPLTENPTFYIGITIVILLFFFLLFKHILNKRTYDRHILENRLQLLKQNLNPHFIFNSLNLIYSLVLQNKNKAAVKTINHFSDLHRYYLDNINKPKIYFEDELKFIESYLKLESERVQIDAPFIYHLPIYLDKKIGSILVPPMILQPLVENAVKYCGTDLLTSEVSSLWIDIKQSQNTLIIGVENTLGDTGQKNIYGSGLGLKLVNERIEIFNKTYKENLSLLEKVSPVHSVRGYRNELVITF